MNKGLLLMLEAVASIGSLMNPFASGGSRYSGGRTPGIPHSKGHGWTRARVPADGHWHLKYHRSR